MADPIVRWRNPYLKTVREFIDILPKSQMPSQEARQIINGNFGGDFFRTAYQLACQLGLYYEDAENYYPRFTSEVTLKQILGYLNNWMIKYPVPNPYTRGFESINPASIHSRMCAILARNAVPTPWDQVKTEIFNEDIGNDDILNNTINAYSDVIQIKNGQLQLKSDSSVYKDLAIEYADLNPYIISSELDNRNDKTAFFNLFETSQSIHPAPVARIASSVTILEDGHLKDVIFKVFKYVLNRYGEEKTLNGHEIRNASINNGAYRNITLPAYFSTAAFIGIFDSEQNVESLKSANTQRFFSENLNIGTGLFAYFTTQWADVEDSNLTLNNFNRYINNISEGTLQIIRDNDRFYLKEKQKAYNKIYFGAPGTGKSFRVDQILNTVGSQFKERITFHPEYDHASFVGGYKPVTVGEDIKYKFVPQIFADIYVRAWKDTDHTYYFAIEEINRGNCAEIFGDLFQLLDRDGNYTVTPSNELREYLKEAFGDVNHPGIINGLLLPPNLNLLATMNTSDQSLFPMDSAFKRRWTWEYVPIDYNDNIQENPSASYMVRINGEKSFRWIDFIREVNHQKIKVNPNLGMDKCIGNYFIKPQGREISLEEFINKAVFYLWNDVFRDEDENNSIFEKGHTYEDFFPVRSNGVRLIGNIVTKLNNSSPGQNGLAVTEHSEAVAVQTE